jgi:hypothetical protein
MTVKNLLFEVNRSIGIDDEPSRCPCAIVTIGDEWIAMGHIGIIALHHCQQRFKG